MGGKFNHRNSPLFSAFNSPFHTFIAFNTLRNVLSHMYIYLGGNQGNTRKVAACLVITSTLRIPACLNHSESQNLFQGSCRPCRRSKKSSTWPYQLSNAPQVLRKFLYCSNTFCRSKDITGCDITYSQGHNPSVLVQQQIVEYHCPFPHAFFTVSRS